MDGKVHTQVREPGEKVYGSSTGAVRGIPDYSYEVGSLEFVRDFSCFDKVNHIGAQGPDFFPFGGAGTSLGKAKTKIPR